MSHKYFDGLNYTLGNEDTNLEVSMVKKILPRNIFSICGSGGRSLPLIVDTTENIVLADLSEKQLMLAKLRVATYKQFSFEDFLKFWSYFPYESEKDTIERKSLFDSLKLENEVREYFSTVFSEINYSSLLYLGKWEQAFKVLAKINRFIVGSELEKLFSFTDIEKQKKFYNDTFKLWRFKLVLLIVGNKSMFNALLYKGDFINKNVPLSHYRYYRNAYDRLFNNSIARKSFFLNLCFYGHINFREGNPVESQIDSFERINKTNANISYVREDFVTYLSKSIIKYDFLSLSDVPSYFSGDIEKNYLQLIRPALNKGAIIVIRYYLRVSAVDTSGFEDVTHEYSDEINNELVQMYIVKIYKYL